MNTARPDRVVRAGRAHTLDISCDDNSSGQGANSGTSSVTERRASLVNVDNDKSYLQEYDGLEDEQCESRGVTAGPYLVIAVLAALAGIAIWLLL